MAADAQVNPDPKAAKMTISPGEILPSAYASDMAMGMEAAVVLPYLWMLLYILSMPTPSRFATA